MKKHFKLFSNCILVNGASRSSIYDLQRRELFLLPNEIAKIIERLNNKESIHSIKEKYKQKEQKMIDEAISFLIQKEFGFLCDYDDYELFTEMDLSYSVPSKINNIIIELDDFNIDRVQKINHLTNEFLCQSICFIFYFEVSVTQLEGVLELFRDSKTVGSIEIMAKFSNNNEKVAIDRLIEKNKRLDKLTFFNTKGNIQNSDKVNYLEYDFKNFSFCGGVSESLFSINQNKVLESINFNSCLYKKLSIDRNGNIKNCPNFKTSFGTIDNLNIDELLLNDDFTHIWKIKKDDIKVCQDCEFRHVCTDCRAFLDDYSNIKSKPLKCGYDPYSNEWSEWSTNPLKQKAKNYYSL